MPMAVYLITGVAGFIGSSIARELVRRGEIVRGIDNFSTGKPANLASIRDQIDFREVDLLDYDGMKEACRGVDHVFHEAAIPSVPLGSIAPTQSQAIERTWMAR